MPSLSTIIGNAIQNNLKSQNSQLGNALKGGISGAKQNIANLAITPVNNAVNAVSKGVKDVMGDVLSGNFSNISSDLGGIAKAFGNLTGPTSPAKLSAPQANNAGNGHVLAGALARPDPMMSYQWFCDMPSLTSTSASGQSNYQLPWYYVEEVQATFRHFDTRSIFRQGRPKHYVSGYGIDSLNCVIYADVGSKAMAYIELWTESVLTPFKQREANKLGGSVGKASKYKQDIKVYVNDTQRNVLFIFVYKNCFPVRIQPLSLDSGTSTRLMFHVEFSTDDLFIETSKSQSSQEKPIPTPNSTGTASSDSSPTQGTDGDAGQSGEAETADPTGQLPDEPSDPTGQLPDEPSAPDSGPA